MKKLSAIAILFTCMFSVAYGQEMKTSPAFDNIHNDQEIMNRLSPAINKIYALVDAQNSMEVYSQKPVSWIRRGDVTDINAHIINVYPSSGDLFFGLKHYSLLTPYGHFIPAKIIY